MKAIHIILLAIIPLNIWANHSYNSTLNYVSAAYYQPNMTANNDTANIVLSDSKIVITENDSTVKVTIEDKTKTTASETTKSYEDINLEVIEGDGSTRIIVHKDGDTVQQYEMNFDELGDVEFSHKDKDSDNGVKNDKNDKSFSFPKKKKNNRFKGHWSGFEMGLNNYLTEDFKQTPHDEDSYMEINTGKSWNFNINFAQFSIPLIRDRVGLVSGLGIEWSNYHFANKNTIIKDAEGRVIVPKDLREFALKKNRLQTTYLTAPILLEVQLGDNSSRNKRVAISAGVIAGLKLGSHTKVKTGDSKAKNKDDFYLQSLRYGFTGRVHYGDVGLYFNYYQMPLFINGKGPELYPYAAGIVFSFN